MTYRQPHRVLHQVLIVVVVVFAATSTLGQDKTSVPSDEAQAEALELIKEVYGQEWEMAETPKQKQALATKLLKAAGESADPTNGYALLKVARDVATQAGDADLAFRAIDAMASRYDVDTYKLKGTALSRAAKSARSQKHSSAIAERALALIDQAVEKDDFVAAEYLGSLALDAARKGRDGQLVKRIVARNKEIEGIAKAYEGINDALLRLKENPVDPDANLAVGRYYCFFKRRWDRGLPMLALGGDEQLKKLAMKELGDVPAADEQVALGDGWWDSASSNEEAVQKQIKERAVFWYRHALPGLSPLVKAKVEKRLKEMEEIGRGISPLKKEISIALRNGVKMDFVLIPAGEFLMGSHDAVPQHRVKISKPFYLGKYEVTQAQWQAVMGNNPSHFKGLMNPVEKVSWNEFQPFLARLDTVFRRKSMQFRLPTEAQWEYACRAGTTTAYSFGDDAALLAQHGWFKGNSGGKTRPVGQGKPNPWGLYDMHGNVWERCADWYGKDYYGQSPPVDPIGPPTGLTRVVRGGSWYNGANMSGSAFRFNRAPEARGSSFGFRVRLVLVGN